MAGAWEVVFDSVDLIIIHFQARLRCHGLRVHRGAVVQPYRISGSILGYMLCDGQWFNACPVGEVNSFYALLIPGALYFA
jgi:hypothetical protein